MRVAGQTSTQCPIAAVTLLPVPTALPAQPTPTQHFMQTNLVANASGENVPDGALRAASESKLFDVC